MEQTKIPAPIVIAINSLLSPFGVNIQSQINQHPQEHTQLDGVKYLSPSQAGLYASMSRFSISRAIKAGKLPAMKMNDAKSGKVLISVDDLNRWIRSRRIKIRRVK